MIKIKLEFCEVFLRDDGILQIIIFPHVDVTVDHVRTMIRASFELTGNKMVPIIMFLGEFSSFGKEAREFSANPENENVAKAIAYVIDNMGHRLIINFYVKINKPVKPIKTFSNEAEAIKWLSKFK